MTDLTDPRVARAIALAWREAELLDDKDYETWADLYTPDAWYVVPTDPSTDDFASSLNMVYDDDRMRRMRVARMTEGFSPSAVAAARTARTVSRFSVAEVSDAGVRLRAAQVVVAYKRGSYSVLAGDVTYQMILGATVDTDRIGGKVIRLLNCDDPVSASGFLL